MQHAKKMLLISPESLQQKTLTTKNETPAYKEFIHRRIEPIEHLENEMHTLLDSKITDDRDKWMLYYQLLQRYFRHAEEERKPFSTQHEEKESQNYRENGISNEHILEAIPITLKRKATSLLNWISRKENIKWDSLGEVNLEGVKITGSNIVDLIRDLLSERKVSPPIGMKEFCQVLKKLNVPSSLIINRTRWESGSDFYNSPPPINTSAKSTPSTSTSLPSRGWSSSPHLLNKPSNKLKTKSPPVRRITRLQSLKSNSVDTSTPKIPRTTRASIKRNLNWTTFH